jgi:multidrug resistance protein, MATE family
MKKHLIAYFTRIVKSPRVRSLLSDSLRMGWPLILIMLFEFLISITDIYIAGKFGKETQGAVGFTAQLYFVFIVAVNALTMGTVAVVSKLNGEKKCAEHAQTVSTVAVSSVVIGLFLGCAGYFIAPIAIASSSLPEMLKPISQSFLSVYILALPFHCFITATNGILRASLRAKRSLVTMAIVAVLNIATNIAMYLFTDIGFRGIALSTVISIIIGAALNAHAIRHMFAPIRSFSWKIFLRVSRIGLPNLILQVSWQFGSLVLFLILGLMGERSVDTIAGFTTGLRIESVIFLPAYALNMSAAALTGNLLGARRGKDAFYSGILTALAGMAIIIVLSVIVIINARALASFLSDKPLVVDECVRYLIIQMIAEPFMAVLVILSGALNGAGDTFGVMRIVVAGMWLIRVPLSWFLGVRMGLGPAAVWFVMDTDIIIRMIFIVHRFARRKWLIHA